MMGECLKEIRDYEGICHFDDTTSRYASSGNGQRKLSIKPFPVTKIGKSNQVDRLEKRRDDWLRRKIQ